MKITEKRCIEISNKAFEFVKMYKIQIQEPSIRDNFLQLATDCYQNEEEANLFKCFVIFNNPKEFLLTYKNLNKDIDKLASNYHTTTTMISVFIDFLKTYGKNKNFNLPPKKLSLEEENKLLRLKISQLESIIQNEKISYSK